MAGEFTVCIDKLVAPEACFEPANGGDGSCGGGLRAATPVGGGAEMESCSEHKQSSCEGQTKKKRKKEAVGGAAKECRICQEEGEEKEMDAPCACKGTLKFAHRKCIQRWCNKKGNINCEICNQAFAPNYTAPSNRPRSDAMAIDIRQNWETLNDLREQQLFAIAAAQQDLLNADYEDLSATNSSGSACCRVITLILMLLLLLRHIFIIIRSIVMVQDMSILFYITMEFVVFFLPCYVIARSCYLMPNWRSWQV